MEKINAQFENGFDLLFLLLNDEIRDLPLEVSNICAATFIQRLLDLSKLVENETQFSAFLDFFERTKQFFQDKLDMGQVKTLITNFGNHFVNWHRFLRLVLSLNFTAAQILDCLVEIETTNREFVMELTMPYTTPEVFRDDKAVGLIRGYNELYLPLSMVSTIGPKSELVTLKRICRDKVRVMVHLLSSSNENQRRSEIAFVDRIEMLDIPQRLREFLRLIYV
jgi:hypothetical protein